jgi:hypothetical protein
VLSDRFAACMEATGSFWRANRRGNGLTRPLVTFMVLII